MRRVFVRHFGLSAGSLCPPAVYGLWPARRLRSWLWAVTASVVLVSAQGLRAEERTLTVAFWNAHNLFDPAKDPNTRDGDFTPRGKFHWDDAKLAHKIELMAAVVREIDADIIGFAEVENDRVLGMLAEKSGYRYHYLIDRRDPRGIDVGMISKLPMEAVKNTGHGRGYLHTKVQGLTVAFAHWKSKMGPPKKTTESRLQSAREAASLGTPLLLLGDFNEASREPGRSHLAEALGMEDLIPRSACQSFYEKGGGLCLDGVYLLRAPACTFDEVEAAVLRPEAMGVDKRHKAAPDIEYSDHWPVRVKITFECAVEEKNTESAARETAWQSDSFFLALPEGLKILVTQASQLLYGVLAGIWGHSSVG